MTDRLDSTEFLPYGCHDITDADIECVVDVLKNHNITQGIIVPEFEAAISHYVKSLYCLVTTNATSSLHLAYLALNVSKGFSMDISYYICSFCKLCQILRCRSRFC